MSQPRTHVTLPLLCDRDTGCLRQLRCHQLPFFPRPLWAPTSLWICSFNSTHQASTRNSDPCTLSIHSPPAPGRPAPRYRHPPAGSSLCCSHSADHRRGGGEGPPSPLSLFRNLTANDHIHCWGAECPVSISKEDCQRGGHFHFPCQDSQSLSLGVCCCESL